MNADLCAACRDSGYPLCEDCLALERAKQHVTTLYVNVHGWGSARVVGVSPYIDEDNDDKGWRIVVECTRKGGGPVEIRNPDVPGVRVVPRDEFQEYWSKDTPHAYPTDLVRRMAHYVSRYDLP